MPDTPRTEIRLPEIHLPVLTLPEMTRADISRVIADVREEIDLSRLDPRRRERTTMDRVRTALAGFDLSKAMTDAARSAGLIRAPRRSPLPYVVVGIVAVGLVAIVLAASPLGRPRLAAAGRRARRWVDDRRAIDESPTRDEGGASGPEPMAQTAVPIEPAAYAPNDRQEDASSSAVPEPDPMPEPIPMTAGASAPSDGTDA